MIQYVSRKKLENGGGKPMRLTYLGHSGFCLETRNADFLMDCIGGYRRGSRPVAALVSHDHADHWRPAAVACADVLVRGMVPGETREIYGARIRAYGSTDEGVSFLISVEGKQIFHAGDLNFWHWAEESTPEEVAQARWVSFHRFCGLLEEKRIFRYPEIHRVMESAKQWLDRTL